MLTHLIVTRRIYAQAWARRALREGDSPRSMKATVDIDKNADQMWEQRAAEHEVTKEA